MADKRSNRQATLSTVINTGIMSALKNVHTVMPGIISSFNADDQTADVTPGIKKVLLDGREIILAKKVNAQVCFMRSGGFSITNPILKGDECIMLFSERSLENWHTTGKIQAPKTDRMHDLSDVFILPYSASLATKMSDFNNNAMVIQSDAVAGTKIIVHANGKVEINNTAYDLVGLINDLNTSLNGSSNSGGPLVNAPGSKTFAQLALELATFKV